MIGLLPVPGWNVPSSALKAQTKVGGRENTLSKNDEEARKSNSRKRKRSVGGVDVTQDNVGELYSKIIEGRSEGQKSPPLDRETDGSPHESTSKHKKKQQKEKASADKEGPVLLNSDLHISRVLDDVERSINRQSSLENTVTPNTSKDSDQNEAAKDADVVLGKDGRQISMQPSADKISIHGKSQGNVMSYSTNGRSGGHGPGRTTPQRQGEDEATINVEASKPSPSETAAVQIQLDSNKRGEKKRHKKSRKQPVEQIKQDSLAPEISLEAKTNLDGESEGRPVTADTLTEGARIHTSKDQSSGIKQGSNSLSHHTSLPANDRIGDLNNHKAYKVSRPCREDQGRQRKQSTRAKVSIKSTGKQDLASAHTEQPSPQSDPRTGEQRHVKKYSSSADSDGGIKENDAVSQHPTPSSNSQANINLPTKPTTLTPLQQKMQEKLSGGRFRLLNEQLYTSSSTNAAKLFATDPLAYETYHTGFRAQVRSWPSNPVDQFIKEIRIRAPKRPIRGKNLATDPTQSRKEMLPHHPYTGKTAIVDLGCGDANLAAALSSVVAKKPHVSISSFDLSLPKGSNKKLVTAADITNLRSVGVKDDSFAVAICCLSLMSTNWVKIVDECARILVRGGEAWIAEVRSRFRRKGEAAKFKQKAQEEAKRVKDKGKKRKDNELDGAGDWREELEEKNDDAETDVSGFVDIWKRRGFELKSEVDKGNKMFVSLRFVKMGKPVIRNDAERHPKFGQIVDEKNREAAIVEEGRVLKPCVYKTR